MFSIIQPLFLQKTKPVYPHPKYLFGIGQTNWADKFWDIWGIYLAIHTKMFKFLNQCFARLWFWKSVSRKTAVAPSSSFVNPRHFSKTEVVQNTDLRI